MDTVRIAKRPSAEVTPIPQTEPSRLFTITKQLARGRNVLHITANTRTRNALRDAIKGTRYEIVGEMAPSRDVLEVIEKYRPDVAILSLASAAVQDDRDVPPLDLLSALLGSRHVPPVLVTDTSSGRTAWAKAREIGAVGLIEPGASRTEILESLQRAVEFVPGIDPLRRRHVRIRARLMGWFKKPGSSLFSKMEPATVENISVAGVGINALEHMPRGSVLKLRLGLPDVKKPIKTSAEVVWSRPTSDRRRCQLGLKFLSMDGADRDRLEAYVERRLSED